MTAPRRTRSPACRPKSTATSRTTPSARAATC